MQQKNAASSLYNGRRGYVREWIIFPNFLIRFLISVLLFSNIYKYVLYYSRVSSSVNRTNIFIKLQISTCCKPTDAAAGTTVVESGAGVAASPSTCGLPLDVPPKMDFTKNI